MYFMLKNRIMHRKKKKKKLPLLKCAFSHMKIWENVITLWYSFEILFLDLSWKYLRAFSSFWNFVGHIVMKSDQQW